MAISIAKSMLNVSKLVNVTIDMNKISKVSTNRIHKFLTTGIVTGEGIAAQIALNILQKHNAPNIHKTKWRIKWHQLPAEEINAIQAVGSMVKLTAMSKYVEYFEEYLEDSIEGKPSGSFSIWALCRAVGYAKKDIAPFINPIMAIKMPPSDAIKQIAEGIKARSITEITINLHTGE